MLIDFQAVYNKEKSLAEMATAYSPTDLGKAFNSYIDFTIGVLDGVSNEAACYVPFDPEADDPYAATETARHEGWSLIHLVMHVTAGAEEAAAFSSLLARGIAIGGRLRSEVDWQQVTTCAGAIARLEESRRICLSYLATWPATPDLTTVRIMPENVTWPGPNAPVSFLLGLLHWDRHIEQFQKVAEQARSLAQLA